MHERPTTVFGVLHVEMRLPLAGSLKEKRAILRPAIARLRRELNVSVAEVADQDQWRSAVVAIATVSNAKPLVENTFRETLHILETRNGVEILDEYREIF